MPDVNTEDVMNLQDFVIEQMKASETQPDRFTKIVEVLKSYAEPDNLMQKTELSQKQVNFITKLILYKHAVKKFLNVDIDFIDTFITSYLELMVSKDRKGRQEFISTLKALGEKASSEDENETMLEKLLAPR